MKLSPVDCATELLAYTYHLTERLPTENVRYDEVSNHYQALIQRARNRARSAGIPVNRFDEALFAVFAWIDETILETGWGQSKEWIKNSLQKKYFNTTSAGEEFFTRLEKLRPEDRDLLEVYDYCLASGFKGCLFESFHQEKLAAIQSGTRNKLTDGQDPDPPAILFPEAGDTAFGKPLKRKRWKVLSGFPAIAVLLPTLVFLILYYLLDARLTQILNAAVVSK